MKNAPRRRKPTPTLLNVVNVEYPLKYRKIMKAAAEKVKEGKMSFLEYQAITYMAIGRMIEEFKREYPHHSPSEIKILREQLEKEWLNYDPYVREIQGKIIKERKFETFWPELELGGIKCLIIGEYLGKKFRNRLEEEI